MTLGGTSKATNAGEGFAFEVTTAGTFTLAFSKGVTQTVNVLAGRSNIKGDLVDGRAVAVNLGLGPLP